MLMELLKNVSGYHLHRQTGNVTKIKMLTQAFLFSRTGFDKPNIDC